MQDIVAAVREMPELSPVADQLVALRRNSIRITATKTADEKLDSGVSKLGGLPDLPDGFAWPMREVMTRGIPTGLALPFVAQLQMADLAPSDVDRLLPASGILYFFYLDESHLYSIGAWSMEATSDPTNRLILHYDNEQPYPSGTDTDARLLLQVDSQDNNGMSWGRSGKLYFFLQESDLAARRWDTVRTREQ